MLLPKADEAVIDPAKIRDYLLSPEHPVGRFKARFFAALGFRRDRWEELASALRTQHLTQEATSTGVVSAARSSQSALFWLDRMGSPRRW